MNATCLLVVAGRALEEQLRELTRLVLRLPEVDGLLQRAALQHAAARPEPAPALEMFVKACENTPWRLRPFQQSNSFGLVPCTAVENPSRAFIILFIYTFINLVCFTNMEVKMIKVIIFIKTKSEK